jgi:hypothetical protein
LQILGSLLLAGSDWDPREVLGTFMEAALPVRVHVIRMVENWCEDA